MAKEQASILIVDDSPDTVEVIQRNLAAEGHRVVTAASVPEAIAALEKVEVDLVITDLKMPKISGLDLVRHVHENLSDTAIMMITGHATIESAVEAVRTGAEEYITKPFTDEEYFGRYIHFDDVHVFLTVASDRKLRWRPERAEKLAAKKRALFAELMHDPGLLFPGVSDLIPRLAARLPLAICSMGRRDEIEPVLTGAGLRRLFTALVTADDVEKPKPDPEVYLRGLEIINRARGQDFQPAECVVVEDSCGGTRSGKAAGMRVVALTHSMSEAELRAAGADLILDGIPALSDYLLQTG